MTPVTGCPSIVRKRLLPSVRIILCTNRSLLLFSLSKTNSEILRLITDLLHINHLDNMSTCFGFNVQEDNHNLEENSQLGSNSDVSIFVVMNSA